MGPKVVSGNSTHRESYPSIYKGNHWDNYFSLLPICVPSSLFTVFSSYSFRDTILSPKIFHSFLRIC